MRKACAESVCGKRVRKACVYVRIVRFMNAAPFSRCFISPIVFSRWPGAVAATRAASIVDIGEKLGR